jgi:hypothetical protein
MPVPYAKDRTTFDPKTCRQPGGYQVGPKGSERWFTKYEDALRFLLASPVQCWRRPSATSGRFGIVTGVGFLP